MAKPMSSMVPGRKPRRLARLDGRRVSTMRSHAFPRARATPAPSLGRSLPVPAGPMAKTMSRSRMAFHVRFWARPLARWGGRGCRREWCPRRPLAGWRRRRPRRTSAARPTSSGPMGARCEPCGRAARPGRAARWRRRCHQGQSLPAECSRALVSSSMRLRLALRLAEEHQRHAVVVEDHPVGLDVATATIGIRRSMNSRLVVFSVARGPPKNQAAVSRTTSDTTRSCDKCGLDCHP